MSAIVSKLINVTFDHTSNSPDYYLVLLNKISDDNSGVHNLGIYASIKNISHQTCLQTDCNEKYVHAVVQKSENPGKQYKYDQNNNGAWDFPFNILFKDGAQTEVGPYVIANTVVDHTCPPRVSCPTCGGTHHCASCGGRGDVTCSTCGGSGNIECDECGGSGVCRRCDGKEKLRCPLCDGTGTDSSGDDCNVCYGRGWVNCPDCNGRGYCAKCHGYPYGYKSGRIKCPTCDTKGIIRCRTCGGNGACRVCRPDGTVVCRRCEGSGNYQTYSTFTENTYDKYKRLRPKLSHLEFDAKSEVEGISLYDGLTRNRECGRDELKTIESRLQQTLLKDMTSGEQEQLKDLIQQLDQERKTGALRANDSNDKLWKTEIKIESIPITTIEFEIENKPYRLQFFGTGSNVQYSLSDLPKIIKGLQMTDKDDKYMRNADPKARMKAYIILGEYISLRHHGKPWQSELRNHLEQELHLKQGEESLVFTNDLEKIKTQSEDELLKSLEPLMHSKKTLAFVWHCITAGYEPNEKDMKLLNRISKAMNLTQKDINLTRQMAHGIDKLLPSEQIIEYVEPEKDTRAIKRTIRATLISLFILVVAAIIGIKYYNNSLVPKWGYTKSYYCNKMVNRSLEKDDYEAAKDYILTFFDYAKKEGESPQCIVKSVDAYIEKATKEDHEILNNNNPLIESSVELYHLFDSPEDYSQCEEECENMCKNLVMYYVGNYDFIAANRIMERAGVAAQVEFSTAAIEYLIKSGKESWAEEYHWQALHYVDEQHNARHMFRMIQFNSKLDREYGDIAVRNRWKQLMKDTQYEPDFHADKKILTLLRAKSSKNRPYQIWVAVE